MPYKHIAAQLKKTELACRLHYHQLSFGSKSRRTTSMNTVHSVDRSSMTPPDPFSRPAPQRPLPSYSPPGSPEKQDSAEDGSNNANVHKPILPKPVVSSQRAGPDVRSLRLVTDDLHSREYVDTARLDQIYDTHRLHFWSIIARNYGGNLSPAALEDAWRRAQGMSSSYLPPTPRGSPQSSQTQPSILTTTPYSAVTDAGKGSIALHSSGATSAPNCAAPPSTSSKHTSFAISALLTENKEIRRSPSQEKRAQDLERDDMKAAGLSSTAR